MWPGAGPTRRMSSPDEVSFCGAGLGPEGGQQAGVCPVGPGALRAPVLGPDMGAPWRGEGEGGFADPVGLESERQVMEAGGLVLWGRQSRPGSLANDKGGAVDSASRWAPQSAVNIVQQLTDQAARGVWSNRSPESCAAEVSALWAGLQAGARGRGTPALMCVQSQPASTASIHLSGPERGRAWGNPKIGSRSRMKGTVGRRWPSETHKVGLPSYPESSDELSEIQLMRVSPYLKEGGKAKPLSPEDPWYTPRHINFHTRVNFLPKPRSFLSSTARAFTLAVERQAVGELDFSSSKKMQSVVWHNGGNRPSYQAAAAAAAAGGLATPRRKAAQVKESIGVASQVAQGRTFPSWGQRLSAAPLDPATFPPISGVPLLGTSKKYSFARARTKQSKDRGTGRKSVARRTRESEPLVVAGEDDDPKRNPATQGQPPAHRPGPCCPCTHRGEGSHGDLTNRAPEDPENSQSLALCKGDVIPRGSAPPGDQEPLDHPPRPERQQQPRGAQGCPRCLMLRSVIDDLKEQLAAIQSLADKFQRL